MVRPIYGIANLDDQLGLSCTRSWHLLHFLVGLIQIKLVAATQTIRAVSVAIPFVILAFLRPGQTLQVEVQVHSQPDHLP